jgi:hypothetical protein
MPALKEFKWQGRQRLTGYKRTNTKRALVFELEVAVGAIACVGTILWIFAWTGAGL